MVQESPLTVLFYLYRSAWRTRLQGVEVRTLFGASGSAQRWWIAWGERGVDDGSVSPQVRCHHTSLPIR
jgi:hypothetical protein